jgi:SAM-dependent methyltransferase
MSFQRHVAFGGAMLIAGSGVHGAEIAAPYVPTAPSVVERMLEIAQVGPRDYVIDLGSGDGRIVITAAKKHGARGLGIEINPDLVAQANANARAAGVGDRAAFRVDDLFTADLSEATVVTMYLLRRSTIKLRERLLTLRPGTRIVSHAGSLDDWKADHFEMLDVADRVRPDAPRRTYLHYWVVPANVAGTWRWSMASGGATRRCELVLSQRFQMLSGTLRVDGREVKVEEATLTGDRITIVFSGETGGAPSRYRLAGRVAGDSISGTASAAGAPERIAWRAERAAPN